MYSAVRKECDSSNCNKWAVGFVRIYFVMNDGYKMDIDKPFCTHHSHEYRRLHTGTKWTLTYFDTLNEFRPERYDR